MRRAGAGRKVDASSKTLIAAVKQFGARYLPLNGVIDGIIEHRGQHILVDWKTPGDASLTPAQAKLVAEGWAVKFVSTVEQLQTLLGRVA